MFFGQKWLFSSKIPQYKLYYNPNPTRNSPISTTLKTGPDFSGHMYRVCPIHPRKSGPKNLRKNFIRKLTTNSGVKNKFILCPPSSILGHFRSGHFRSKSPVLVQLDLDTSTRIDHMGHNLWPI